jgi:hypothetical protein
MAKIRKFAAFLAFTLVGCGLINKSMAQGSTWYEEEPRTFYAGPIIGANFSQIDGDNYAGYSKTGFNAGGILYAHLANKVAVSMEILYSQKGARSTFAKTAANNLFVINKYKVTLSYAEVPVQLCFFDKRKSHFGAGLSYSQLIGANEVADVTPTIYAPDFEKSPFKKMDINLVLGGNLHLYKGLFLNFRFQYSVVPIRKGTSVPTGFGRAEQFSNMYTLRLMYLFI